MEGQNKALGSDLRSLHYPELKDLKQYFHSTPLLHRDSERGRHLPWVTQQGHGNAGIRILNFSLELRDEEASRFACLEII